MDLANAQGSPTGKDMGSGESVVPHIRVGLKRELSWMLKTQLELGVLPPSRKRVSKLQSLSDNGRRKTGSSTKKMGKFESNPVQCNGVQLQNTAVLEGGDGDVVVTGTKVEGDETKAEEVLIVSPDVGAGLEENGEVANSVLDSQSNNVVVNDVNSKNLVDDSCAMEMSPSKRSKLNKVPTRVKDLLGTGMLEGLTVRYIQGSKGKLTHESKLEGIIQGTGILCSCMECRGTKVVTPNQFELHAGSGNKRPPEYIYLKNGKCLRDILNACKNIKLGSLKSVIQKAIGCPNGRAALCVNCNALMPEAGDNISTSCNSCFGLPGPISSPTTSSSQPSSAAGSSAQCPSVSVSEVSNRRANVSDTQPNRKRQGKLTKKDLRMHKSILDEIPEGEPLEYCIRGKILLKGVKKGGGILCKCCDRVMSPSAFEIHAGHASRRKPYTNIFTSDGVSLHQLSLELSKIRRPNADERDDLCSICADGGILLECGTCPRAFHNECIGIGNPPEGEWQCKYCRNLHEKAKLPKSDSNEIAALAPGVNLIEEITKRCTRIVGKVEFSRCAICRRHEFDKGEFSDETVLICDQCEREYHIGCLREHLDIDLKKIPEGDWFCCTICADINVHLHKRVEEGEQKLPQELSDIISKKFEQLGLQQSVSPNVSWRLLRGETALEDSRAWLCGAVSIFHDRFDPISDSSTGHVNVIPHLVYGRQTRNGNFFGMYCAVLMVDSVVVCAGIFRIFGEEIAELPLVATKTEYQGKGYFQALYYAIENLLSSVHVRTLVLPAAEEAESLWTEKFGFAKFDEEKLSEIRRRYHLFVFSGTTVLHKSLTVS